MNFMKMFDKRKRLKGRVWERNKCFLKDAKICPDYAAIIFFSEKFIF